MVVALDGALVLRGGGVGGVVTGNGPSTRGGRSGSGSV